MNLVAVFGRDRCRDFKYIAVDDYRSGIDLNKAFLIIQLTHKGNVFEAYSHFLHGLTLSGIQGMRVLRVTTSAWKGDLA